jgi:hypothetical protein
MIVILIILAILALLPAAARGAWALVKVVAVLWFVGVIIQQFGG